MGLEPTDHRIHGALAGRLNRLPQSRFPEICIFRILLKARHLWCHTRTIGRCYTPNSYNMNPFPTILRAEFEPDIMVAVYETSCTTEIVILRDVFRFVLSVINSLNVLDYVALFRSLWNADRSSLRKFN